MVQDFNLDWREQNEELQAQEEPSTTIDETQDNGWDPPAEESMDAVGNSHG